MPYLTLAEFPVALRVVSNTNHLIFSLDELTLTRRYMTSFSSFVRMGILYSDLKYRDIL